MNTEEASGSTASAEVEEVIAVKVCGSGSIAEGGSAAERRRTRKEQKNARRRSGTRAVLSRGSVGCVAA